MGVSTTTSSCTPACSKHWRWQVQYFPCSELKFTGKVAVSSSSVAPAKELPL